jgi:outer membrane protein assembly factor BamB
LLLGDVVAIVADRGCQTRGYVYAFNQKTGKLLWKFPANAPATNLLEVGDSLIFATRTGELVSVQTSSGAKRWQFKEATPDSECEFPRMPASDGVRVSFVSHKGALYTLDANSGRELWKEQLPSPVTTGLFMYKDALYFGTDDGRLHGINPANRESLVNRPMPAVLNGRFSWQADPEDPVASSSKEYAFASSSKKDKPGMLLAFSDEFEHILWSQTADREWTSEQPHLWKGWVVAGNCRGDIVAYRRSDGQLAWSDHVNGCVRSFGDDGSTLYIGVQQGTVYAYRR